MAPPARLSGVLWFYEGVGLSQRSDIEVTGPTKVGPVRIATRFLQVKPQAWLFQRLRLWSLISMSEIPLLWGGLGKLSQNARQAKRPPFSWPSPIGIDSSALPSLPMGQTGFFRWGLCLADAEGLLLSLLRAQGHFSPPKNKGGPALLNRTSCVMMEKNGKLVDCYVKPVA